MNVISILSKIIYCREKVSEMKRDVTYLRSKRLSSCLELSCVTKMYNSLILGKRPSCVRTVGVKHIFSTWQLKVIDFTVKRTLR